MDFVHNEKQLKPKGMTKRTTNFFFQLFDGPLFKFFNFDDIQACTRFMDPKNKIT